MNTHYYLPMILLLSIVTADGAIAQESPSADAEATAEDADREQLRQFRESLIEAVIKGDVEKQIEHVLPDVVTIWQNNQVARGHDGLREFMSEFAQGDNNVFQGYTERPSSDDVMIFPGGNVAVAYGTSVPHYKWMGLEFDLQNRWSASLLKTDGQWKIATYHVSGNLVDNPLLTAAKQSIYWVAGISIALGVVLGVVGTKMMGKRNSSAATS
jgi:ketosteroid isomerase-like protein